MRCDIELDCPGVTAGDLQTLEEIVATEIRAGRPVTSRRVSSQEYADLEVRSRGLPAGHRGDIRLVEIGGVDLNTCGGTHVASTSEIESSAWLGACLSSPRTERHSSPDPTRMRSSFFWRQARVAPSTFFPWVRGSQSD